MKKMRLHARTFFTNCLHFFMRSGLFRWFLCSVIRTSKFLPDNQIKARICNWTQGLDWRNQIFPAAATYVGTAKIYLVPHANEFDFYAAAYKKINYEAEVYQFLDRLENYDCIIDIGANVGIFSLYAASRFKAANVFAFEPGREAFLRLLINLKENPNLESRVNPFFAAVGAKSSTVTFYTPCGHITNSSIDPAFAKIFGETKAVIAQVAPKDLFEERFKLSEKILVKIDAEGSEPAVLSQLRELIDQSNADLLVEILPHYSAAMQTHFDYFQAAGYLTYSLQEHGPILMAELNASNRWRDWWFSKNPI